MPTIEIGANRNTLLKMAEQIRQKFENSNGELSVTFSTDSGDDIVIGNEDMERDDIDDDEIYVDISS